MIKMSLCIALVLCPLVLNAQTKKATVQSAHPKTRRVQLNFEDELVNGSTEKPDVSNIDVKTDFNYKKLIRVRENFVNEMENGLNDFKGN